MEKKALLTAIIISALLFSAVDFSIIGLGKANPATVDGEGWMWIKDGEVPAPEGTEPPEILFFSPKNNACYTSNNIPLIFNVTEPESYMYCSIDYKASWQPNKTHINNTHIDYVNINLTDIREGSHYLEVNAEWQCVFESHLDKTQRWITHYTSYNITGSATVYFTVDFPPKISIISIENKTYRSSVIPLDFIINEPILKATYSLDEHGNVTIIGNTTLTGLSYGDHNVIVYATDNAGNIGASKTITFTIAEPQPEPFPTTMVIAPIASVAIIGSGLLVYFKKRKHQTGMVGSK